MHGLLLSMLCACVAVNSSEVVLSRVNGITPPTRRHSIGTPGDMISTHRAGLVEERATAAYK